MLCDMLNTFLGSSYSVISGFLWNGMTDIPSFYMKKQIHRELMKHLQGRRVHIHWWESQTLGSLTSVGFLNHSASLNPWEGVLQTKIAMWVPKRQEAVFSLMEDREFSSFQKCVPQSSEDIQGRYFWRRIVLNEALMYKINVDKGDDYVDFWSFIYWTTRCTFPCRPAPTYNFQLSSWNKLQHGGVGKAGQLQPGEEKQNLHFNRGIVWSTSHKIVFMTLLFHF